MEEALVAYIIAASGVTALLGTTATRVYWGKAPQNVTQPYVVLSRVSGVRDYHQLAASGLIASRVQADCYGITYASAKGVARALEARLSGYRGTTSGEVFGGIFLDAERDMTEDDDSPDKLFRTSLDFIIWHQ
jgi:hypothetical protein